MQLINKITGETARIEQTTLVNCRVGVYENGIKTPYKYYNYQMLCNYS